MKSSQSFTKTELTTIRSKTMKTKKKMTELINLLFKKKRKIYSNVGVQTGNPEKVNSNRNLPTTSQVNYLNVNGNGIPNYKKGIINTKLGSVPKIPNVTPSTSRTLGQKLWNRMQGIPMNQP